MNGVTQKQGFFHRFVSAVLTTIESAIQFADQATISVSAYLLGLTLLLSSSDAMMGGHWIKNNSRIMLAFSILQGVGIEAQIRGAAHRMRDALHEHRTFAVFGWLMIALCVGLVAVEALWMFGVEHSDGLTETQAFATLHLTSHAWWLERAILGVILIFLGAFAPYRRPKINLGTEEELAQLKHDLTLNPLRTQLAYSNAELNAARVQGVKQVAASALRGRGPAIQMTTAQLDGPSVPVIEADPDDEPEPPTTPDKPRGRGRGRPSDRELVAMYASADSTPEGIQNMSEAGRKRAQRLLSVIDLVRDHHDTGVKTTIQHVVKHLGGNISTSTASKLLKDAQLHLVNNEGYHYDSNGAPMRQEAVALVG